MSKLVGWKGRGKPEYPVVTTMERFHDGIDYRVGVTDSGTTLADTIIVWQTSVQFTARRRNHNSFVQAAREQRRVAEEWVKFIAKEFADA